MTEPARLEYVEAAPTVRLHIRDWGQGSPVVMIPGWPLGNSMWDYQMTPLATQGWRPISISQRGFGKSDKPWGPYNYDVYADDLKAVLDRLNLRDATLVGHSMGGAVAIRYMSRHQESRVAKLVLVAAAAPRFTRSHDFHHGQKVEDVNAMIAAVDIDRPQLFTDFGNIFGANENSIHTGLRHWMHHMGMEASPWAVAQSLVALRDSDLRRDMAAITVPTAIFHAVGDKVCPYALGEALARGIKGSKLVTFENSGHGLFLEERARFNAELMAFASVAQPAGVKT